MAWHVLRASHPNVINSYINRDSIEWAVTAAGGAAVPCIGYNAGWFVCVGGVAAGTYAARAVYLIGEFTATCWMGGGECDEKPPCDLYPNHPCCQI